MKWMKDAKAFYQAESGEDSCYIPLDHETQYTRADFFQLANDDPWGAERLFQLADGEYLEDLLEQEPETGRLQFALLREDIHSYYLWLQFPESRFRDRPDDVTLEPLRQAKEWRFGGYRKQWYCRHYLGRVPQGVAYVLVGDCDYSGERSDRLGDAAHNAEKRSEAHHKRAHALTDMIPFGQPILYGRRGVTDRNRRDKSWNAMGRAVEESKKAEDLAWRSQHSRQLQQYKHSPAALHRRIEEVLKKDLKTQQWFLEHAQSKEGEQEAIDEYERRVLVIQRHIIRLQNDLEAAGGLPVEQMTIEPGDIIQHVHGMSQVEKVHRVNIAAHHLILTLYSGKPWPATVKKSEVLKLVCKAKDADAYIQEYRAWRDGKGPKPLDRISRESEPPFIETEDSRTSLTDQFPEE